MNKPLYETHDTRTQVGWYEDGETFTDSLPTLLRYPVLVKVNDGVGDCITIEEAVNLATALLDMVAQWRDAHGV